MQLPDQEHQDKIRQHIISQPEIKKIQDKEYGIKEYFIGNSKS